MSQPIENIWKRFSDNMAYNQKYWEFNQNLNCSLLLSINEITYTYKMNLSGSSILTLPTLNGTTIENLFSVTLTFSIIKYRLKNNKRHCLTIGVK